MTSLFREIRNHRGNSMTNKSQNARRVGSSTWIERWLLIPHVRYINYLKAYPNYPHGSIWKRWLRVERYWDKRMIIVGIKHLALVLDFRRN